MSGSNFADRLKAEMSAAGITCRELAERIGASEHTVRAWRIGRRRPCCRYHEEAAWRAVNQFIWQRGRSGAADQIAAAEAFLAKDSANPTLMTLP